jgi:hypothetical protein
LDGQNAARPVEGMLSNRNSGNPAAIFRGAVQGTSSLGASDDRNSRRSSGSASDALPIGASNLDSRAGSDYSNPTVRGFIRSQTGNGGGTRGRGQSQGSQSRSQDTTTHPTNDTLRDFLQLRRDNSVNPAKVLDKQYLNGKSDRRGSETNLRRNAGSKFGQFNQRDQVKDPRNERDQAWIKQFGSPQTAVGNISRKDKAVNLHDGKIIPHNGSTIVRGDASVSEGRKLDRNLIDRTYQDWRNNATGGGHVSRADHRDWSGRWKNGERLIAANDIRHHWKNNTDHTNLPFSDGWWRRHDRHEGHHGDWNHFAKWHRPFFWWNWCSAPRLTTWFTFDWPSCYYWDYGPGEYLYCHDGVVYVNGVWFEPTPLFYERTLVLAQSVPILAPQQAAQIEWLPLGVFVIARDGVADNNVLVQLAVTRDGVIGGTIFNQLTGATFDIEGTVDKQTQRAVWTFTDDTGARIIMETSIFNLTQPEATGLIHYGPDNIQVIELVRLEQPNPGP